MRPEILHLSDAIQGLEEARDGIVQAGDATGNADLVRPLESLIANLDRVEWYVRDVLETLEKADREEPHD